MNKQSFMKELKQALSVLQEEELRDILDEYEQHIDLKVASGLTEEEAIADFGSLSELTAEILEAYHVRADYAAVQTDRKKSMFRVGGEKPGKEPAGKDLLKQTGEVCGETGRRAWKGLGKFGKWMLGVLIFWKDLFLKPLKWLKRRWEQRGQAGEVGLAGENGGAGAQEHLRRRWFWNRQQQSYGEIGEKIRTGEEDETGKSGEKGETRVLRKTRFSARFSLIGGIIRLWILCKSLVLWCVRMGWNLCWIGFSAFCGIMGLFSLYGMGVLVVLMAQGYPLTGVTIGCLGLNLCLFSAAGLGWTLLWRKKKEKTGMSAADGMQMPVPDGMPAEAASTEVKGGQHA